MAKLARMDHEKNMNVFVAHDTTMDAELAKIGSLEKVIPLQGGIEELNAFKNRSRS